VIVADGWSETSAYRPSRSTQPSTASCGLGAPPHGVDHREPDGDHERLEDAKDDDASSRHPRDCDLDMVDRSERAPGVDVDEADRGRDDDRAEHGLRQVLHGLGQDEQDHQDGRGGDDAWRSGSARPCRR
jgi:hypothetical protein